MFLRASSMFFLGVLLIFLWGAGLVQFITMVPKAPTTNHDTTDAIVVLTGGSFRLERGFELLAEGKAPRMFISGVEDGLTVQGLLSKKEYHEFAGKISPDRVTLGFKARSTAGNAAEISEWVAKEHIKTIRLVTSYYHIPRSVLEIHKAVPGLVIITEPVFSRTLGDNTGSQYPKGFRLVVSEYDKYLVAYFIKLAN